MQILQRRYQDQLDARANELIRHTVDGVSRMQTLIEGLLSFSRVGTRGQAFEPTSCETVLQQALAQLEVAIAETGAVITHDPLPEVHADAAQLTQLLQNLLGNAIKFHGQETPKIHVTARRDNGGWLFSVKDNGIGMEKEYFERHLRHLPAAAYPHRISRHGHRPGHLQENRRAPWRPHLRRIDAGPGLDFLLHSP